MIPFPIISGHAYESFYPVNCYYSPEASSGKPAMVGCAGLKNHLKDTDVSGCVRAMHVFDNHLYAVIDVTLYRKSGANMETIGTISSPNGPVIMEHSADQLAVVENGRLWIVTTDGTMTDYTEQFPGTRIGSIAYQDGYFVGHEIGTGNWYESDIYDGASWNGSDYAITAGNSDNLVRLLSDHREIWAMGEKTCEVYYNSGASDFSFSRVPGGFVEKGLAGPLAVAKKDNTLFFLTHDRTFVRIDGYVPRIIGTRHIADAIQGYDRVDDCIAFTYAISGGEFVAFVFPDAKTTWEYNIATQLWHERRSYLQAPGDYTQWRANCHAVFNSVNVVGDFLDGVIYEIDPDTYDEGGEPLIFERVSPPVESNRNRVIHHAVEFEFETGVGLITGQGSDASLMMDYSDDDGSTWKGHRTGSIGEIGERLHRVRFNRLGSSRKRLYRLRISDPIKRVLCGAYIDAAVGRH